MHSNVVALSKASIWHEASRIAHEEGFRAFWKGNLVTVAHRLPYSSVNFYAYECYKKVSVIFCGMLIINLLSSHHCKNDNNCQSDFLCSSCNPSLGRTLRVARVSILACSL